MVSRYFNHFSRMKSPLCCAQAENVASKQASKKRKAAADAADPAGAAAKAKKKKKAWWEEELDDADRRKRLRDTQEEDAAYYREEVGKSSSRLQFSGIRHRWMSHRCNSLGGSPCPTTIFGARFAMYLQICVSPSWLRFLSSCWQCLMH